MRGVGGIVALLVLAAAAAFAGGAAAQTGGADPVMPDARVRQLLDQLKLKYSLTALKNYEVDFTLKDRRRQTVFVNSNTETFGRQELRQVTSTAFQVEGALPADTANRLLEDNDRRKLGAWRTVRDGGKTYVIYAVQIPAQTDPQTLEEAMDAARSTADAMEREVTGKDEF
jgi:hypothetical protein